MKRGLEKKALASFEIALLIFAIFAIAFLLSDSLPVVEAAEQKVCCEKTNSGGWCVFTEQSNCDSDYRISATSCESTSYCKQGCCFDSDEGMEPSPQLLTNKELDIYKKIIEQCNMLAEYGNHTFTIYKDEYGELDSVINGVTRLLEENNYKIEKASFSNDTYKISWSKTHDILNKHNKLIKID